MATPTPDREVEAAEEAAAEKGAEDRAERAVEAAVAAGARREGPDTDILNQGQALRPLTTNPRP